MGRLLIWIGRGSILSLSTIIAFGTTFSRTAILSRLLLPEEFGTSVAIATTYYIASLATDLALDQFIITHADKNSAQALATVHTLSIARGFLLFAILIVAARYMANLFDVPQFADSFAVVALCPLISSFSHMSIKQIRRTFKFAPDVTAQIVAQLSALGAVFACAYYFRDHRAILASFLTEAVVYTVLSHGLARSAYRVRADGQMLRTVSHFSVPLMVNGIGLAALAQLDRVLVGSWLGVETLGRYVVIFSLGLYPIAFFFRVIGPLASASLIAQRDVSSRDTQYSFLLFGSETMSVAYALFVALTLDWLVPLLFGQSFHVSRRTHLLVMLIGFFRLLRGGAPTSFLLVMRKTKALAVLNLISGLGIVCAFWLVHYWPSIGSVLFGLLAGEVIALILLFGISPARPRQLGVSWKLDLMMSLFSVAIITGTLAWSPEPTWQSRAIVFIMGSIGLAAQLAVGFRNHKGLLDILSIKKDI